jgi:hypothetical protein
VVAYRAAAPGQWAEETYTRLVGAFEGAARQRTAEAAVVRTLAAGFAGIAPRSGLGDRRAAEVGPSRRATEGIAALGLWTC